MSSASDTTPPPVSAVPVAPEPRRARESEESAGSEDARSSVGDGIRASDAERERTVACLHRALGDGRLDLDETEHRVAAAYATVYREELPPLLADLPAATDHDGLHGSRSDTEPDGWARIWSSLVWRAHLIIWGSRRTGAPTPGQLRAAGYAVGLAVLWTVFCAIAAAMAVAA